MQKIIQINEFGVATKLSRTQLHAKEQQSKQYPLFLLFRSIFVLLEKINNVRKTTKNMTRKCPVCTRKFKWMDVFVV